MMKDQAEKTVQREVDQLLEQAMRQPGVAAATAASERTERFEGSVPLYSYAISTAASTNQPATR